MISKLKSISAFCSIIIVILILQGCQATDNEIAKAVRSQLERYPESRLQDIYKSFFQDEFGPGHLLEDTAGAREYLDLELEEMVSTGNHNAELCGTGKNFYRVPLDLVKDGVISEDQLFNAFMESASAFSIPAVDSWKKKWEEIVKVIEGMGLNIPNFDEDKKALSDFLNSGLSTVHHSKRYEELYNPHYRIVGKEQWLRVSASLQSAVGSRRSAVGSQRSAVGGQRSAVGGQRSAVGSQQLTINNNF